MKIFPIFIPHLGCPFHCVYCEQEIITKSKPALVELISHEVKKFCEHNRSVEKEIAFFGGTFTNLPKKIQQTYFDAVNKFSNSIADIRISTRPDTINKKILDFCNNNNVRTIELGIQSFDNTVLTSTKRGYTSQTAKQSCQIIKENNFLLGIQLMPGLPGSSADSIKRTLDATIEIKPDFVRIYPTIVLKNTELEKWFNSGKFIPLSLKESIKISAKMINEFKKEDISVIKVGLHSDISKENIVAGPYHQSFGELVRAYDLQNRILQEFKLATLEISPADISLFKGFNAKMLNEIKLKTNLQKIPIMINKKLKKNSFIFSNTQPDEVW